jgi:hypothetical protein
MVVSAPLFETTLQPLGIKKAGAASQEMFSSIWLGVHLASTSKQWPQTQTSHKTWDQMRRYAFCPPEKCWRATNLPWHASRTLFGYMLAIDTCSNTINATSVRSQGGWLKPGTHVILFSLHMPRQTQVRSDAVSTMFSKCVSHASLVLDGSEEHIVSFP